MENTTIIKELFDSLYLCEKQLTAGQMDFIQGCKKHFIKNKSLSLKQLAALREIRKYLPAQDARFSKSIISLASGMKTEGLSSY